MATHAATRCVEREGVEVAAAEEVVLGQLTETAAVLARRQGGEDLGVAEHGGRLPEGAHEVLALGQVHTGLAADGGVDLAEQRGGDVHDRHAPVVHGGGEAGGVGDDPAADGHHRIGPVETPLGELTAEVLDRGQALGFLAVGHLEHPVLAAGVDVDADAGLGDDGDPPGRRRHDAGQLVTYAVTDEHVVGVVRDEHGDDDHAAASRRSTTSNTSATTSVRGSVLSMTTSATSA